MEEYIIRDGVVLEEICGRFLLISTIALRDKCPYVYSVQPVVAYYWYLMEQGLSIDEMVENASAQFPDVNKEVLKTDIVDLIEELREMGYLLSENESR